MHNSYIGLDPSFTGFGISTIDEELKELSFYDESYKINRKSTLLKFEAIEQLPQMVKRILSNHVSTNIHVGQEVSTAYTGWFIAELYALDFEVFKVLKNKYNPLHYDLFSQTYITYITGHKSSLKEQTIFMLEDKILPIFVQNGYSIVKNSTAMTKTDVKEGNKYIKRETITNNEADSFIYALREFIKYSDDESTKSAILEHLPKLKDNGKELK